MIAIINISPDHGIEYGKGIQKYRVQINHKYIVEFEHVFEDGLSVCLEKASKAVKEVEDK